MFPEISVVLVRPRFPENIGMAARAMANMGVRRLFLVEPERFELEKALPLATVQGKEILESAVTCAALAEAVAGACAVIGTTARTGGWRQRLLSPEKAALEVRALLEEHAGVALVFGPEDKGLLNAEVELCTHLVSIPTPIGQSSLNLAQAVLILLYECAKTNLASSPAAKNAWAMPAAKNSSRRVTSAEEQLLFATVEQALLHIGHLDSSNPAWFMRPMRHFLRKSDLRRHELDMIMGICRQVLRLRHIQEGKE